ncbi:hypothetical protein G5714_009947 [Onychostoma macrolepis]|uniref:Uncharacterized protein n=1 Tax=Onychostoma macrolepis TaxID=369639 RepID=A0A7J6CP74_9TELE|nr:hypothetical protein G5714_009947 [Onychostoma macrolepis]
MLLGQSSSSHPFTSCFTDENITELKCPPTGAGTESGEATAATWPWFILMDEAIGGRPSISPPVLISSSIQNEPGPSSSSASVSVAASPPSPQAGRKKRKRSSDLMDFLKLDAEKEDARERAAVERSERFLSLFETFINKF